MKGLKHLFGVCLGVLALCNARGVEYDDIARAASRTNATNISITTPMRGTGAVMQSQKSTNTATTRSGGTNARTAAVPEPRTVTKNVATRTTTNTVAQRSNTATRTSGQSVASRTTAPAIVTRGATKSRGTATTTRRSTSRTTNARTGRKISRAATTTESGALVTNYTRCREIYYECMDEFCANKDANLRRCACSARANEFDSIKNQMSKFEDKMLDFNQRLLLVNMDAADVTAINQSTEGEDAFYSTTDKTKSKRALDEIAKKLNTTFGDDDSGLSLAPISLSLNLDSAFDTVDSFMGSDTVAKSGTALYNAAIPICRETALEVCTEDELSLAIGGYLMLMEQDCNTVQKSYQAQVDSARAKVFESGALLDMSRLDAYQTRNSDDILTCKRKMMEMLTNSTVCGTDMEKCLDMTGKYIDPTTGAAFLTPNLADLGNLITRPDATQSWTSANGVGKFITYLNNKKQFITPATENCQDIADTVWDAFIEDALAQIKLAQDAKLEEIRQACTTLTSECLTSAAESIDEFDARALSVFGVAANQTVESMCSNVRNSCTALMDATGDTGWGTGMSNIATYKTFDTIVSSCTQVGRNCIIQSCRSISGNFDLCDDTELSPNRHAILERTACWSDVLNCVAAAGNDTISAIMESFGKNQSDNFYSDLNYIGYTAGSALNDICKYNNGPCTNNANTPECATCRIAERIWGNCEDAPSNAISEANGSSHNRIWMPRTKNDTLLSWFAINTGTANSNGTASDADSCINTRCTTGQYGSGSNGPNNQICIPEDANLAQNMTSDGLYCPANVGNQMTIMNGLTNCCYTGQNGWGHIPIGNNACCETRNTVTTDNNTICLPGGNVQYKVMAKQNGNYIICVGDDNLGGNNTPQSNFPNGDEIRCAGRFVVVTANNKYDAKSRANMQPNPSTPAISGVQYSPQMVYYQTGDENHTNPTNATNTQSWFIRYNTQ